MSKFKKLYPYILSNFGLFLGLSVLILIVISSSSNPMNTKLESAYIGNSIKSKNSSFKHLPPPATASIGTNLNGLNGGSCYYGACYYYVRGYKTATSALGATANISQSTALVNAKDQHSLTELAVESSDGRQIVEVGWTVDKNLNGDNLPHLFTYNWVNGVPGCYNSCGFVPVVSKYSAGGIVSSGTKSTYSINYTNSQWVISYNGIEIGYYPVSLWSGNFTSLNIAQAFGEVASAAIFTPETQMGNGILGTSSTAGLISNFNLLNSVNPSGLNVSSIGATIKYGYSNVTSNSFYFGGPGYTSDTKPYVNFYSPTISALTVNTSGNAVSIPGKTISKMTITWGDKLSSTITNNFTASHVYKISGTYTIVVTATDSAGQSSSANWKVTI